MNPLHHSELDAPSQAPAGWSGSSVATASLASELVALAANRELPGAELVARLRIAAAHLELARSAPAGREPYAREVIHRSATAEIMLARWRPGAVCAPHDHGGSRGFVVPLAGELEERRYRWQGRRLAIAARELRATGAAFEVDEHVIHDMAARGDSVTLHVYAPPPTHMAVYDLERSEVIDLVGDFGAWLPEAGDHPRTPFARATRAPVIFVAHTTRYRGGSAEFAAVARTMVRELGAADPECDVQLHAVERKAELAAALRGLAAAGRVVRELHFVGHSGMYGIMFGSVAWPEQFSPHEWRTMAAAGDISFEPDGRAYFHACRTGRWFAPFFARTFGVTTYGHHGYTTVSASKTRFAWAGRNAAARDALYLVATPGKKSHGLVGSVKKYAGARAQPMLASEPRPPAGTTSYDRVAELYDRAWVDVRVRRDEWAWIERHAEAACRALGRPLRVLEVGCGNGAMLRALDDKGLVADGVGLDDSVEMLARAGARSAGRTRLRFTRISGPVIDAPDDGFDVVLSFLSFRYLDWDPLMAEVRRVLAPGGRMWMVDMVEQPLHVKELPQLVRSFVRHAVTSVRTPVFARDLRALVEHPDWKTMVAYNPIRAAHEYKWYFESRFPGRRLEVLTVTPRQRVVAFDTGALPKGTVAPLSFP